MTVEFSNASDSRTITPQCVNLPGANSTYGYTAILSNMSAANLVVLSSVPVGVSTSNTAVASSAARTTELSTGATIAPTAVQYIPDSSQRSITVVGMSFKITPVVNMSGTQFATLTIIGNETGGRTIINIKTNSMSPTPSIVPTTLGGR